MSSIFSALFRSASTAAGPPQPAVVHPVSERSTSNPVQPVTPTATAAAPVDDSVSIKIEPVSPLQAAHDTSFSSNSFTPQKGDQSFDVTTSTMSEAADILVPRGVPYVHMRRPLEPVDPTSTSPKFPSLLPPASSIRSHSIPIRHPSELAHSAHIAKPKQLTEWRKEQVRKQNLPKLKEPVDPKPIPTLHGAATLPYARNPSGVDSNLVEETAHLYNAQRPKEDPLRYAPARPTAPAAQRPPGVHGEHTVMTSLPHDPIRLSREVYHDTLMRPRDLAAFQPGPAPMVSQGPLLLPDFSTKPQAKVNPSDILRSQLVAQLNTKVPASIARDHRQSSTAEKIAPLGRGRSASMSYPAPGAAQRIIEDADTYPVTTRYIAEEDSGNISWDGGVIVTSAPAKTNTFKGDNDDTVASKIVADSKADASVNWRLKTPAKATPVRGRQSSDVKLTPISDRSDDGPVMTIDSLFEKFAPSSGLSPVAIKVHTPPHTDPAIAEVSGKPLVGKNKQLLRAPSPDASVVSAIPGISSGGAIERNLTALDSEPDENSVPARHFSKAARAKGTPGAGKLLQRGPTKKGAKESTPPVPKKAPLGSARTVPAAAKGKASRQV